jgi:hypothetical protein
MVPPLQELIACLGRYGNQSRIADWGNRISTAILYTDDSPIHMYGQSRQTIHLSSLYSIFTVILGTHDSLIFMHIYYLPIHILYSRSGERRFTCLHVIKHIYSQSGHAQTIHLPLLYSIYTADLGTDDSPVHTLYSIFTVILDTDDSATQIL